MLFYSTVFRGTESEPRMRRKPTTVSAQSRSSRAFFGSQSEKVIIIPSVAAAYNDEMGAVNTADQLRASERYIHRVLRGGWKALAWTFLLETVLVNSFKLQSHKLGGKPGWKPYEPQSNWRLEVINSLVEAYGKTGNTRKRYRSGDTITPVTQHNRVYRGLQSRCLACQGIRFTDVRTQSSKRRALGQMSGNIMRKRAKKTSEGCDVCDVAICSSDVCWDFYHTPI